MVVDLQADTADAKQEYGMDLVNLKDVNNADCLIFAVVHDEFRNLSWEQIDKFFKECPKEEKIIIDVKSILDKCEIENLGYNYLEIVRSNGMYKVGICGHFGENKEFLDGQTIKTKTIAEELQTALGSQSVQTVDTYGWKNNPIALFIKCYLLIKNCKNIIILPAHNGVKAFVPLFLLLNKIFHRKLHYIVIGGWLPELLEKNHKLKNKVSKFDGIYVETHNMVEVLRKLGLKNVRYLPNFKRLDILEENTLIYSTEKPYKLCTFSRVMEEKGIEDAIDAIININKTIGRQVYTLDIYGQVDEKYSKRFEKLKKDFPEYISYKGVVNFNNSVKVLKKYFALLFPTHFRTEGIPGTIIDAYAAGLPVLTSQWDSANEIIVQDTTGFIYDFMQKSKLEELLFLVSKDPKQINKMKKNCLKKAKSYLPETVIGKFTKYL